MKAGNATYLSRNDLPETLGVFPLDSILILPSAFLSLNVFEKRYLDLVQDAIKGDRVIGIIQVKPNSDDEETPPLYKTGCMARIVGFNETGDDRIIISLQGICRFNIIHEEDGDTTYRRFRIEPWLEDLIDDANIASEKIGHEKRSTLMNAFSDLFEAHNLDTDWDHVSEAPLAILVNALAVIAPFNATEKQVILETPSTIERVDTLIALAERSVLTQDGFHAKDLQ